MTASCFCLLLVAALSQAQGLGDAAAREKTARERTEAKEPARVYDDEALEDVSSREPRETRAEDDAEEKPASGESVAQGKLARCPPGSGLLRAWSEAKRELVSECGQPAKGTSSQLEVWFTVSADGRAGDVVVKPEDALSRCVAGRLRGRMMREPPGGEPCRANFISAWLN